MTSPDQSFRVLPRENSGGTTGLYRRGRGQRAEDMLLTSAGLWIARDNEQGTQTCGIPGPAGTCFLPYP